MFKKKLLGLVMVSALVLSVEGCSSNKDLFEPVESPEVKDVFVPDVVWSESTQGTKGFYSQLVPCISGNNLYIAGRKGKVYAFDATNGDSIWKIDLSDEKENDNKRSARLNGGMSASDHFVAVGSENGYLYVLNKKDGSIYYKQYLGQEVLTPPCFNASGDKLFVLDSTGKLNALDLVNKKVLWTSGDNVSTLHLRSQAKPIAVGDEMVVLGTVSGRMMFISQNDGLILNQVVIGQNNGSSDLDRISDVSSTPLLLGDSIYSTAYNAGFVKYSLEKSAIVGRLAYYSSKDIAYDDNFFVITGDNGTVYCVRRSDNIELWANSQLRYRNVTSPAIYGNYAVVGDLEGYIYFINLNNGQIESKVEISGSDPIYVAPIVAGNCIVVYCSSGAVEVLCYDPANIVMPKKRFTDLELVIGNTAALVAANAMSPLSAGGVTKEDLEKRRAQARQIVAQIEAHQRQMEAQYREYQRQKAEYEKRVAEYEKQKREQLSGFGVMPEAGVKSDNDVEFVEEDSE
ncbi:MAG: PQQ-binding-like beta-propeller repeat protein [Aeromonadales bacterium]|nr:PQQ-binding-like beta-propeller repeat protein [Aeromonadales bacterium]